MPATETILNELESAALASIKAANLVLEKCHKARKQLSGLVSRSAARKGVDIKMDIVQMKINRKKHLLKNSA